MMNKIKNLNLNVHLLEIKQKYKRCKSKRSIINSIAFFGTNISNILASNQ